MGQELDCGCVLCTCEDKWQCQGCGAKFCGEHGPGKPPGTPKGTAFVCVQLLNTVKRLAKELKPCACPYSDELRRVDHDPTCIHWQAHFLIEGFEQGHMPEDAEVWLRVVTLIQAMQDTRVEGSRFGYAGVRESVLDELAELADGRPRAVTDAYACIEALRLTCGKMQDARKKPISGKTKQEKASGHGYRKAIDDFLGEIESAIANIDTDVLAGMVEFFAAWLTTLAVPITIGGGKGRQQMSEIAGMFIDRYRLRRVTKGD